jgi:hypothetical protein
MFCEAAKPYKTFPKLKGKAAEIKAVMPALLEVWKLRKTPDLVEHDQITALLECSCTLDKIMTTHVDDDCFPAAVSSAFKHLVFSYNVLSNSLCVHYGTRLVPRAMFLFNVVPKNHYLAHLGLIAAYLNPQRAWCYMGEDFMHKCRMLGNACARGNVPQAIGRRMIQTYLSGLSYLLCKNE